MAKELTYQEKYKMYAMRWISFRDEKDELYLISIGKCASFHVKPFEGKYRVYLWAGENTQWYVIKVCDAKHQAENVILSIRHQIETNRDSVLVV